MRIPGLLHLPPPRACWACAVCAAALLWGQATGAEERPAAEPATLPSAAARKIDFARDVFPLLKQNCFRCHQGQDAESGVRLDVRRELLGETTGDPLAVPGGSERSRLIHLVARVLPKEAMPPSGEGAPLSNEQVGILRAWIDQGLAWDESLLPPPPTKIDHWAFQPIARPPLPEIKNAAWARTPVDAFVAADHEARGLSPADEADRRALIRRVTLDLTGLSPAPGEIAAFLADSRPDAYEHLVDRLLASPRYGERWGRHWLDLARWAETEGYESNHSRPFAWRYRDYVIAAFNADKPYDRFLREQLAGDEMEPYADEHLIATGFLAAARLSSNEEDKKLQRNDVLVDITNSLGSAVLGLTIGCAQCHNHKFDPITQRDYYRVQGLFVRGQPANVVLRDAESWAAYNAAKPAEYDAAAALQQAIYEKSRQAIIAGRRATLPPQTQAALALPAERRTPEQERLAGQAEIQFQLGNGEIERGIPAEDRPLYDMLKKRLEEQEKKLPPKPQTWAYYSPAGPTRLDVLPMKGFYPLPFIAGELNEARPYVLVRGEVHRRGPRVEPGWPEAIGGANPADVAARPRTALVDWLVDREHPLTARVRANHAWRAHFGRGIVPSAGDFGVRGEPPTHPQLLDWLAAELIDSGWSGKHLDRLIVLSAAYRQSSRPADAATSNEAADPDNFYLWRFPPRRLEAEALRDAMLLASGELDGHMGGRGVPVDDQLSDGEKSQARIAPHEPLRRSVYLFQKRDRFPEMQRLFDGPTTNESCAQRYVSTVALQPLYLLNSEFAVARARAMARRVQATAGDDPHERVAAAFEIALGRQPDEQERRAAAEFFAAGDDTATFLVPFCQALLNLNEFAYLE